MDLVIQLPDASLLNPLENPVTSIIIETGFGEGGKSFMFSILFSSNPVTMRNNAQPFWESVSEFQNEPI